MSCLLPVACSCRHVDAGQMKPHSRHCQQQMSLQQALYMRHPPPAHPRIAEGSQQTSVVTHNITPGVEATLLLETQAAWQKGGVERELRGILSAPLYSGRLRSLPATQHLPGIGMIIAGTLTAHPQQGTARAVVLRIAQRRVSTS